MKEYKHIYLGQHHARLQRGEAIKAALSMFAQALLLFAWLGFWFLVLYVYGG